MNPDALLDRIAAAADLQALDAARVSLLGKSGEITARLKQLGGMDESTRAVEAPKIHALRDAASAANKRYRGASDIAGAMRYECPISIAVSALRAERPDVVVTDIRMPPTDTDEGLQVAATLRRTHPQVGVVIVFL